MSVTFGPTPMRHFAYYDRGSRSLRTSQATFLLDWMPSSVTLPKQGSMRNGELYEHPTWALPTDENDCSSLLGTPNAHERTHSPRQVDHGAQLANQIASLLPTPTVGDSKTARNSTAKRNKLPPTGVHAGDTLTDVITLLPTPKATNNENRSSDWANGPNLGEAIQMLPTPRTSDANGGGVHGDGGLDLRTAVAHAASPRSQGDTGQPVQHGEPAPVDWAAYAPAIRRWERLTRSAPSPTDDRGRLSAKFVEWMQGFEGGFVTDLVPRVGALKCLGNTVVPQVSELIGRQIVAASGVDQAAPGAATADSCRAPSDGAETAPSRTLWPESALTRSSALLPETTP